MNLEILNRYVEEGWLISQTHPTLPLTIYNYSQKTQYEAKWNEITLSCRGLVFDDKGCQVSYPFNKFFNIEEAKHTPTEDFEIYEKVDGSLITIFNYRGDWIVSSRGSFTSEHAVAAQRLFDEFEVSMLDPNATYLFELIAPWNRIVVDYGEREELILLGVRSKDYECNYEELVSVSQYLGCKVTQRFSFEDYREIKKLNWKNHEGFIVRFSNGDRCKIKFEEYIRLHKIMTEVSTKNVWECLKSGHLIDTILDNVPDEFFSKIREYEAELLLKFDDIRKEAINEYAKLLIEIGTENRKEFATKAKTLKYPSLMFAMLDKKDWNPIVWEMVKPDYKKL
jgi:RNA ligase